MIPDRTPELELDGETREQFFLALLAAFPERTALTLLVSFTFNENLSAIGGSGDLREAVFNLLQWVEARGSTHRLLAAALLRNQGNPQLQQFASRVGFGEPGPAHGTGGNAGAMPVRPRGGRPFEPVEGTFWDVKGRRHLQRLTELLVYHAKAKEWSTLIEGYVALDDEVKHLRNQLAASEPVSPESVIELWSGPCRLAIEGYVNLWRGPEPAQDPFGMPVNLSRRLGNIEKSIEEGVRILSQPGARLTVEEVSHSEPGFIRVISALERETAFLFTFTERRFREALDDAHDRIKSIAESLK